MFIDPDYQELLKMSRFNVPTKTLFYLLKKNHTIHFNNVFFSPIKYMDTSIKYSHTKDSENMAKEGTEKL